jgi:heme/copper-type cytochrome/quinol oxidase subunit 2
MAGNYSAAAKIAAGEEQEISMTAKKYAFTPAEIRVKAGTKVRLKITAIDHDHGFQVNPVAEGAEKGSAPGLHFEWDKPTFKIEQNATQEIVFTAEKPGTYLFKCAVFCGLGHGGMKGQIVVEP